MNRSRWLWVIGTALLALIIAPVHSSAEGVGILELNGGYVKSSEDITGNDESLGGGVSFGGAFWYNATPQISPGIEISYDNLGSIDAAYFDSSIPANINEEFDTKVLRIAPQIRVNFGTASRTSFFVQAGGGLYSTSWDYSYQDDDPAGPTSFTVDGTDTNFGGNIGAGVNFQVGPRTRLNFNGAYHLVGGISEEILGIDVEMTESTNYMQFRGGIGFNL
jgi:opacity protein-like surface antigen